MSDPATPVDVDAVLAELVHKDLAVVREAHAQVIAAEPGEAFNAAGRTYQRASRSLRQSLMLKMKHDRERAADPAATPARKPADHDVSGHAIDDRIEELQDAVARVAAAAHPHSPRLQGEALDRLDVELDDWIVDDLFLQERLDDQVQEACRRLDLPQPLARAWRQLPPAPAIFDAAEADDPPVPQADTG